MARSHGLGRVLLTGLAGISLSATSLAAGAGIHDGGPLAAPGALSTAPTEDTGSGSATADDLWTGDRIDGRVQSELDEDGTADFWIDLAAEADLSAAADITDWDERGQFVYETLTATAEASQADLRAELDEAGVSYETFWATNAIRVTDGDADLVESLAGQSDVAHILGTFEVEQPELEPIEADSRPDAEPDAVAWNLTDIKADEVWARGITGEGIVVASIDTGVQWSHPALKRQYRGTRADGTVNHNYNWFDATTKSPGQPTDKNGHGTHVTGTMVGDDGGANKVGVAPGARWIAANGCCPSDRALIASGQWTLAPTNLAGKEADPSRRPHIINNSWGSGLPSNSPLLEDISKAWTSSGQFSVFANGNHGSRCRTSASPGSRIVNYSVGNYTQKHDIAVDSSRGTGQDGVIKPNISAPGTGIRSTFNESNYAYGNGTSMASPHVAGAVALLWSAKPDLRGDVEVTRELLDGTATDTDNTSCGGTAANNNVFGQGRLNVAALIDAAPATPVRRLSGSDRYATASQIAASHSPGVNTVFLATGADYPDALVGAALAGSKAAPVLLTKQDQIPAATRWRLKQLAPKNVVLLGGQSVISAEVGQEARDITGSSVSRMSGGDRFGTAAQISRGFDHADVVYVATGHNYPDALAGAARAGALDGPVLLTQTDHLPKATRTELSRLAPDQIVLLGGSSAISQTVAAQLGQYGEVRRVAGTHRYGTAAKISQDYQKAAMVYIATGENWPDALAGAARAGRDAAPILLVQKGNIPQATRAEVARLDPELIYVLGGHNAINASVEILLGRIE
ncbi:cell wall-binding repeat-containing protein [Ornithinimicrobium cavernae]|uniref:cell wall-binding repeat-containing protein n=1 Tax=Ornithinimicrobium cavernae TaxID=2666047 RepID=UPI000D69B3A9|nr:cell wall-binding repeat-containing protein [Ornithinimicrobium cavernae]